MVRSKRRRKKSSIREYIESAHNQIHNCPSVRIFDQEPHSTVSSDGIIGKIVASALLNSGVTVDVVEEVTIRPGPRTYEAVPGVYVQRHSYTVWEPDGVKFVAFDYSPAGHPAMPHHKHRHGSATHLQALGPHDPRNLRALCKYLKSR